MSDLPPLTQDLMLSPAYQDRDDLVVPPPALFELPETVLQFGTGAFLRGFTDYFIDEANRARVEGAEAAEADALGGRVVIVGSTGSRRVDLLNQQDGLYTVSVEGLDEGEAVQRRRVLAAVSRAISSVSDWSDVLALAEQAPLGLIVSNTTEVGITFNEEDAGAEEPLRLDPPQSFPGKLTALLYRRAEAFDYDEAAGVVVLPCELIEQNGDRLREIVERLSAAWGLGERFVEWLRAACPFPNTLVDRIVPGTPEGEKRTEYDAALGYRDELLIVAETYRLWAIEGNAALRRRLPFAEDAFASEDGAAKGVVVAEDIEPFRQRKVRILNGTHTTCVPAAFLCGNETIHESMQDPLVGRFIEHVMRQEIVPSLDVDSASAERFAEAVLERFRNPYLEHRLLDITLHQTTKLHARVVPSILRYYEKSGRLPASVAFGFACFLVLVRGSSAATGDEDRYTLRDEHASFFARLWDELEDESAPALRHLAETACQQEQFWGVRLDDAVPGFAGAVAGHLENLLHEGARPALEAHLDAAARGEPAAS